MQIHIVRHGEPAYPDDALTPEGHRQARALAEDLAARGLDHVYSSPLRRALDTARPTAARLGLALEVEPWTREVEDWWIPGGAHGEQPVWQVEAARLPSGFDGEDWHSRPPFDRPVLREGFGALQRCSDAFLARHGPGQRLAVFCHEGFGLSWLAHLLGLTPPRVWTTFALPPASVTTVHLTPRGTTAPGCCSPATTAAAGPGRRGPRSRSAR